VSGWAAAAADGLGPAGPAGLAAGLCAGGAAWVATARSGASHRLRSACCAPRRLAPREPTTATAAPGGSHLLRRLGPLGLGVVAALSAGLTAGPAAGVAVAVVAALAHRRHDAAARSRDAGHERRARIALCESLAAELRAGRPPASALAAAAGGAEPGRAGPPGVRGTAGPGSGAATLRRAAGVAQLGGDVPGVLRSTAGSGRERPGEPDALHQLAACWAVAERSGAGLEVAVRRLAESLRAAERQRAELAGELAGARATARLLAVLPGLGLLLAAAVGAQPLAFLLGTPLGGACLLLALGLDVAGLAWTKRLTAGAAAGSRRSGP
jgi:tight adherence protein B